MFGYLSAEPKLWYFLNRGSTIQLKLNCISCRQISTLSLGVTQKTRGLLLVGRRCSAVRCRNSVLATGEKNNLQQWMLLARWCYLTLKEQNGPLACTAAGFTARQTDSGDGVVGLSGGLRLICVCVCVLLSVLGPPAFCGPGHFGCSCTHWDCVASINTKQL